jgi:hypothetical protein
MATASELRQKTIEAIGEALTRDKILSLAQQALGIDPENTLVGENTPRAVVIREILAKLEREGTERWFLTYILITIAQERLRTMIVRTWPNTLVGLPPADDQVESTLKYLHALLSIPLPRNLRIELRAKRQAFNDVRQCIADLHAYKNLHEVLHQLDLKLTFAELVQDPGAAAPDFAGVAAQCEKCLADAPAFPELLGAESEEAAIERGWIAQLQTLTSTLRAAIAPADIAGCLRALAGIQQLTRLHLSRLNGKVYQAAIALSFDPLTVDYPEEIEDLDALAELVHAVRELKPTILARALKNRLWQQAENEISVLEGFFRIPGEQVADVTDDWFTLKKRVSWLASLDPDDGWAQQAQKFSDEIDDDLLNKQTLDDETKAHFEAYRNLFRFRFLAIDNTLKLDCGALRKIDAPLTAIVQELAP